MSDQITVIPKHEADLFLRQEDVIISTFHQLMADSEHAASLSENTKAIASLDEAIEYLDAIDESHTSRQLAGGHYARRIKNQLLSVKAFVLRDMDEILTSENAY